MLQNCEQSNELESCVQEANDLWMVHLQANGEPLSLEEKQNKAVQLTCACHRCRGCNPRWQQ